MASSSSANQTRVKSMASKKEKQMEKLLDTETYEDRRGWRNYVTVSSFFCRVEADISRGIIKVPLEFHHRHGRYMKEKIELICREGFKYRCRYSTTEGNIEGLEKFFMDHWVTKNSLIKFQSLGNRSFLARVYKPIGIEADYNWFKPRRCQSFKDMIDVNVPGYGNIKNRAEDERSMALLMFNGARNPDKFYELEITDSCILNNGKNPAMNEEMQGMLSQWNAGDVINLKFVSKVWKIEITKAEGLNTLGPGWFDFCDDAALRQGDILILRGGKNQFDVLACVIKKDELDVIHASTECEDVGISFFQYVHVLFFRDGMMVPPLVVTKYFEHVLEKIKHVRCGGKEWQFRYDPNNKSLSGILPIMNEFSVKPASTVFFTAAENGEAEMRIFQRDGMEICYSRNEVDKGKMEPPVDIIYISDDDAIMDDEGGSNEPTFTEIMQPSHVDGRSHGVYIAKSMVTSLTTLKAGSILTLTKGSKSWPIGLIKTNNRLRFSKGWNAFVRDNELGVGDHVKFSLQDDGSSFKTDIKYADKQEKKKQA